MIDLRSDTVTKPSPAMREAMARAEVGDDVYGEDPSVIALEQETAGRLGKEAGLFTSSGTQANQIGLWLHARPGEEALVSEGAHVMLYEAGAAPALSGLQLTVIGKGGLFTSDDLAAAYKVDNGHYPPTKLLCVENTHNRGGGRIFPKAQLLEVTQTARKLGLAIHLDGARLWNAHIATGDTLESLAAPFDTVSVCFSKGLGAPVGSVLTGPAALIQRARRRRKMLGGGMRQAGILAAAASHALRNNLQRLADDHANARAFAERVAQVPGMVLDLTTVETNLCIFELSAAVKMNADQLVTRAREAGVLLNSVGPRRLRAVTHLDVTHADCVRAAELLAAVVTT